MIHLIRILAAALPLLVCLFLVKHPNLLPHQDVVMLMLFVLGIWFSLISVLPDTDAQTD